MESKVQTFTIYHRFNQNSRYTLPLYNILSQISCDTMDNRTVDGKAIASATKHFEKFYASEVFTDIINNFSTGMLLEIQQSWIALYCILSLFFCFRGDFRQIFMEYYLNICFAGVIFLSYLTFSTLLQYVCEYDPVAHQDHCGRCRILTRDLCRIRLLHYQRDTESPKPFVIKIN